jgi:hypothetical protein
MIHWPPHALAPGRYSRFSRHLALQIGGANARRHFLCVQRGAALAAAATQRQPIRSIRPRRRSTGADMGAGQGGDGDSINEGAKPGAPLHRLTSARPGGWVRNRSLTARRTPLVEVQIFHYFSEVQFHRGDKGNLLAKQHCYLDCSGVVHCVLPSTKC